jgi:uncharacterized protein
LTTFVDTSGLYALLDENDANRPAALEWFSGPGRDPRQVLVTHNYVVVEAVSLVHRRLGTEASATLLLEVLPAMTVTYIDEELHHLATSAFLAALRRRASLVDWVSFEFMRRLGIQQAFAFDRDFERQAFKTVP